MQLIYGVILIIASLNTLECSLFDQVNFNAITNGDVLISFDNTTAPLEILFNLREVLNGTKYDHITVKTHDGQIRAEFPDNTLLYVSRWTDNCIALNYSSNLQTKLIASVNISDAYMYGGAEDDEAKWPLGDSYHNNENYVSTFVYDKGVLEPYWLLSNGYYIYVDYRVPLFLESNKSIFQLIAKKELPYVKHEKHALNFAICKMSDVLHAHQHAVQNFLGKPSTLPDERLVTHPVWSTEGKFGKDIDHNKILLFAQEIAKHGLTGQLRIDRTWEECPGSSKPNNILQFKNLTSELKKLNFTIALAIDAYVGHKCNDTYNEGVKHNYFVKNNKNDSSVNGQPDGDRFIDLTNPEARNWFTKRLQQLRESYGIDSFKLDNVFSNSPPQPPVFYKVAEDHPETIVKESAKLLASLGSSVQTTVARNIQPYGFFVRMLPRASSWKTGSQAGHNDGLRSIIPTLLQFNIAGYSFVVPDKIGGGDGHSVIIKNRELYIRWTQLNVFMPTMEFAIPPWDFDNEVLFLTKKFVNLHARYSPYIIRLMKEHVKTGAPINRPLWWIAPKDKEALKCSNEFLLGDDVLVAPVLEEGKRSRDIYLPKGYWLDETEKVLRVGPTWLINHTAGLDILPYFRRIYPDVTKIPLEFED